MVFFKVGTYNVTPYIDIQNFDVNQADVYTSWTDGNGVEHRDITRTCIEGKIKVGFKNATDLAYFKTKLAENRQTGGWYPLTAYIQNTTETVEFNGFLELEAESKFDLVNDRFWKEITVTVKER